MPGDQGRVAVAARRSTWRRTAAGCCCSTCGRRGAAPASRSCRCSTRWRARLKAQGIDVLAVSVDQERANVDKFLQGHGHWALTIAHDPAGAIAERLQPDKMPTSYVIDRAGIVRYVNAGFVPDDAARSSAACSKSRASRRRGLDFGAPPGEAGDGTACPSRRSFRRLAATPSARRPGAGRRSRVPARAAIGAKRLLAGPMLLKTGGGQRAAKLPPRRVRVRLGGLADRGRERDDRSDARGRPLTEVLGRPAAALARRASSLPRAVPEVSAVTGTAKLAAASRARATHETPADTARSAADSPQRRAPGLAAPSRFEPPVPVSPPTARR